MVAGCHVPDYTKGSTREGMTSFQLELEPLFPLAEPATPMGVQENIFLHPSYYILFNAFYCYNSQPGGVADIGYALPSYAINIPPFTIPPPSEVERDSSVHQVPNPSSPKEA